jgi:vacuolar protein sorting-associated protein 13A/C
MVDDSEWSKPLSFEAVGSAFAVSVLKEKLGNPGEVLLGVDVAEGSGKYYLTKVITFSPRFLVRNVLNEDLYFQQAGTVQMNLLTSNSTSPLIHMRRFSDVVPHLCIRLATSNSLWSNPFKLTDIGSVYVKIERNDSITEDLIRVDIALEKATIFISFNRQENRWPIRIDNLTEFDLAFHQENARKMYLLPPKDSLQYLLILTLIDMLGIFRL